MKRAYFRFHDELNFFLPRSRKSTLIEHAFAWRASIKDMIESLGVPHAEVELIVVNGASVNFGYIVRSDDRIDVYPMFDAVDLPGRVRLRPPLPPCPSFILDQHLGRLAAYLRMLGFDTLYRNDYHDPELAQISHREGRVLLTRDVGLLKRSLITHGYYVRETHRERQLVEIMRRFNLLDVITPFKHCMKCNGLLRPVEKSSVLHRLPDNAARYYDEFHICASCERIYWKGTHFERMHTLMTRVLSSA